MFSTGLAPAGITPIWQFVFRKALMRYIVLSCFVIVLAVGGEPTINSALNVPGGERLFLLTLKVRQFRSPQIFALVRVIYDQVLLSSTYFVCFVASRLGPDLVVGLPFSNILGPSPFPGFSTCFSPLSPIRFLFPHARRLVIEVCLSYEQAAPAAPMA